MNLRLREPFRPHGQVISPMCVVEVVLKESGGRLGRKVLATLHTDMEQWDL